jgi:putative ABC transport system permease protein
MMSLGEILFVYRARMRESSLLLQEALAVLGIAVGVALLFASQVASTSLDGSVRALASQVVGSTQFQLDSRGIEGFNAQLAHTVERLPGVETALPLLDQQATIIGPRLGFDLSPRRRSTVRALQRAATAALHRQGA